MAKKTATTPDPLMAMVAPARTTTVMYLNEQRCLIWTQMGTLGPVPNYNICMHDIRSPEDKAKVDAAEAALDPIDIEADVILSFSSLPQCQAVLYAMNCPELAADLQDEVNEWDARRAPTP